MPTGSGLRGVLCLPWRLPVCVLPGSHPSWHQGSRSPCSFGWRSRMNSLTPHWVFLSREHTASPLGPCRGVTWSVLCDYISATKRRSHFRTQRHPGPTCRLAMTVLAVGERNVPYEGDNAPLHPIISEPFFLLSVLVSQISEPQPLTWKAPCLQRSLSSFCVFLSLEHGEQTSTNAGSLLTSVAVASASTRQAALSASVLRATRAAS